MPAGALAASRCRAPRLGLVAVYRDQGISGSKGRDKRPGLDRLLQAVARRDIDMVAAWSVDRLGRSLTVSGERVAGAERQEQPPLFASAGARYFDPSGRTMYQMFGVFAEFERSMIRERSCPDLILFIVGSPSLTYVTLSGTPSCRTAPTICDLKPAVSGPDAC